MSGHEYTDQDGYTLALHSGVGGFGVEIITPEGEESSVYLSPEYARILAAGLLEQADRWS